MNQEILALIVIAAFIALIFVPLYFRKKELDKEFDEIARRHRNYMDKDQEEKK